MLRLKMVEREEAFNFPKWSTAMNCSEVKMNPKFKKKGGKIFLSPYILNYFTYSF